MDVEPSTSKYSAMEFESALVLYKSLCSGKFARLASKLEREMDGLGIVPKRIDYMGNEHSQSLKEYLHIRPWSTIGTAESLLIEKQRSTKILLDAKNQKCLNAFLNSSLPNNKSVNIMQLLNKRSIGINISDKKFHDIQMIEHSLMYQYRILGHIDKTYNVRFDRTGRYIITGSDDALIKVWDLNSAMLRYSFRGHPSLVVDMDVSFCNQFIASVGNDKIIRIWSFQSGAQIEVCRHHTNAVAAISFLPKIYGNKRWLVSFANDCNIIFYEFDEELKQFNDRALIFNVRTAVGLKVLSGTHSSCGNWVAAGDSHGSVHLFRFQEENYIVDTDFKALPVQEKLDTLEWSNTGISFVVSSSRHHVGRIWRYIDSSWNYLDFSPHIPDISSILQSTKLKYGICMAIWSLDDSFIIVSGTDFKIRVFDAYTAEQRFCLEGHKAEAFHLKSHPIHENVFVSSAHDGFVIVWDIEQGKMLKKFTNEASDGDGDVISSAILDCCFSPDGTNLAIVDDLGRLTVYGFGGSDRYKTPKEQFFSNDYELIDIDETEFPLDSVTGLAPHLNNPPWLVDLQHTPHEEKWQRKVPGRELEKDNLECAWLTRAVAPKLDEAMLNVWTAKLKDLYLEREEHLINNDSRLKAYKLPGSEEPVVVKSTTSRRRALPTFEEAVREQEQRHLQDNLFNYRSEDDADYEDVSSSGDEIKDDPGDSSDSDNADEDFGEGEGKNEQEKTVTTSSGRRVRSRNIAYNTQFPQRTSRRSRRNAGEDIATNDEGGQSSQHQNALEESPSAFQQKPAKSKRKSTKQAKDEVLSIFPFSMQIVKPKRFPYVPQPGDKVVYFKQGHMSYLNIVQKWNIYPVSSKMYPDVNLKVEEFCVVDEVKYTRKPYRLTNMLLSQLNKHGERSGIIFNVRLHDLQDCPDFIILRQFYDNEMTNPLQEGDEMEAIIDGSWWTGTVSKRQAHSEEFPTSQWNCLSIRWDNGDEDVLSPWDCQVKTPFRKSGTLATAEEEVRYGSYSPVEDDWPGDGNPSTVRDMHCKRLYAAVNELSCLDTVVPFAYPVNLSEFPTYALCVDYCIDLQTIGERLKYFYYRNLKAVQHDIRYIAVAAEQFNESTSVIVKNSRRLVEALIRFSKDESLDPKSIIQLYDSLFDVSDDEIVEYRQRDSKELAEIIKIAASNMENTTSEAGWIRDARSILESIFKHRSAAQFWDKTTSDNHALCVALNDSGDLKSVLDELHLFSHPEGIIKKVGTIMDACREAIDDPRSRLHHSINQVMNIVEQKMKTIVDEYNRIVNTTSTIYRSLRKRVKKNNVYQTRSVTHDEPSTSRTVRLNSPSDHGLQKTKRITRSNASLSNSRESTAERDGPALSRKKIPGSTDSSDHVGSDHTEFMDKSELSTSKRKKQKRNEELQHELMELQEDEEERLESRRLVKKRKRKHSCSSGSDFDGDSNDSMATRFRRPQRSMRALSGRRFYDNSDDEEVTNVSSYGRVRRSRRFD